MKSNPEIVKLSINGVDHFKDGSIPECSFNPHSFKYYMKRKGTFYFINEIGLKMKFDISDSDNDFINNLKYGDVYTIGIESELI